MYTRTTQLLYIYPLAQQSCGDIGSVPYVCMCVRTYVCMRVRTYLSTFVRMFTFFHRSSDLIYYPISILLHTSIGYDNTSNKFAFQRDRVKVKVAVTIFRKNLVITLAPLFIYRFRFSISQMFNITISWTSLSLSILGPRSRSQWLF